MFLDRGQIKIILLMKAELHFYTIHDVYMGRYHNASFIIVFFFLILNSCAFDPPSGKQIELGNNYYASYDKNSPNDGLKITYSKDNVLYKILATNCIDIYKDNNVILFSKSRDKNVPTMYEYFVIKKNSNDELKK